MNRQPSQLENPPRRSYRYRSERPRGDRPRSDRHGAYQRRANALVLSIALVSILAIMGSTFVIVTSLDREAVRAMTERDSAADVEEVVLTGIGVVLANDVAGKREPQNGTNKTNFNPDGDGEDHEQQVNVLAETTPVFDTSKGDLPGSRVRPRKLYSQYTHQELQIQGIFHENEPFDFASHMIFEVDYDEAFFRQLSGGVNGDLLLGTDDDNWLAADPWLADLEPVVANPASADQPVWRHISDLQGRLVELTLDSNLSGDDGVGDQTQGIGDLVLSSGSIDFTAVRAYFVDPALTSRSGDRIPDRILAEGYPADADGDGVADARWVRWRIGTDLGRRPTYLTTPEAHDVYVAVRIVDNAGMINLNTAGDDQSGTRGRSLTDVDPSVVARNNEDPARLLDERGVQPSQVQTLNEYLIDLVDVPGRAGRGQSQFKDIRLFDLADELEIHGRNVINSPTVARFESAWPGTFNAPVITARRKPFGLSASDRLQDWAAFMTEFGQAGLDRYDRRHLATFHSWDRTLRIGGYPVQDQLTGVGNPIIAMSRALDEPSVPRRKLFPEAPNLPDLSGLDLDELKNNFGPILYGFRAYFLDQVDTNDDPINNVEQAATKAAQVMACLIDYVDTSESLAEIGTDQDTSPLFARMDSGNPAQLDDPFPGGSQTRTFTQAVMQKKGHATYLDKNIIETLLKLHPQQGGGIDVDHPDNTAADEATLDGAPYPNTTANYAGVDFGMADGVTVYGYEPQPFITQILCLYKYQLVPGSDVPDDSTAKVEPDKPIAFAIELYNPYEEPLSLDGWRLRSGGSMTNPGPVNKVVTFTNTVIQAGRSLIVMTDPTSLTTASALSAGAGHPSDWISDNDLVGLSAQAQAPMPSAPQRVVWNDLRIGRGDKIYLERPVVRPLRPYVIVDTVDSDETRWIHADDENDDPGTGSAFQEPFERIFSSRRGGKAREMGARSDEWHFTNNHSDPIQSQSNYKQEPLTVIDNDGIKPIPGFTDPEIGGGAMAGINHPFGLGRRLLAAVPYTDPAEEGYVLNRESRVVPDTPGVDNAVNFADQWSDLVALNSHRWPSGAANNKPITEVIDDTVSGESELFLGFEPHKIIGSGTRQYAAAGTSLLDYFTFIRKKDSLANQRELRMHGRVNINTAPAMVLEAVLDGAGVSNASDMALDIIAYREGTLTNSWPRDTGHLGFHRVAELYDPQLLLGNEADRVVSLFTVRSDVVTAYVAIRVQAPGDDPDDPADDVLVSEKRLMALYDRANVYNAGDQPRILVRYEAPPAR